MWCQVLRPRHLNLGDSPRPAQIGQLAEGRHILAQARVGAEIELEQIDALAERIKGLAGETGAAQFQRTRARWGSRSASS